MRYAPSLPCLALVALSVPLAGCKKDAAPAGAPAPPSAPAPASDSPAPAGADEALELPPEDDEPGGGLPALDLEVEDVTTEEERPVNLGDVPRSVVVSAAQATGFRVGGEGKLATATAEVHYALTQDGKVNPKADRGLLTWGVAVGVRVVGADHLAEVIYGRSIGEAPFVLAALPSLEAAFGEVLRSGARGAFLDVAMQIHYRDAPLPLVLDGLRSPQPEERWAATRRAAALAAPDAGPRLLANLESAEGLEVGLLAAALERLKEARAVPLLVDRVDGLPESVAIVVVDALRGFNTPEARAALKRVAEEHPIESVRAAAKAHGN